MRKLLVFPLLSGSDAGYHLPRLLQELQNDYLITCVSARDLSQMARDGERKSDIDLLINWLDTLYFHFVPRKLAAVISLLPRPIRVKIANRISKNIIRLIEEIKSTNIRLNFYFHDLHTFSRIPLISDIDKICRSYFYHHSNAVLFAEDSAHKCVSMQGKLAPNVYFCPLGSYRDHHGELPDAIAARASLGIRKDQTVVLALGTIRSNRSIDELVKYVATNQDLFLLAAGRGNRTHSSENIKIYGGYSENERIRTLLACADYVIHTGNNYLTSSAVRVAISYGIPVIAEDFGATSDMCKGALIPIMKGVSIGSTLSALPKRQSSKYKELQEMALLRDEERTWKVAAQNLLLSFTLTHSNSISNE
jgi:hypothetical protein